MGIFLVNLEVFDEILIKSSLTVHRVLLEGANRELV